MKLVALLMMTTFAAAISAAAVQPKESKHFLEEYISSGDPDLEYEIVDMDDAIQKARMLRGMANLLVEAEAEAEAKALATQPKKRFLNRIKNAIIAGAKRIGHFVSGLLKKAKEIFNKVLGIFGLNFHDVVQTLKEQIDTSRTVAACKKVMEESAGKILGTEAEKFADKVSQPLCHQALAELEKLAMED